MDMELAKLARAVKNYRKGESVIVAAERLAVAAEELLDENAGLTGDEWRDPGDPQRYDAGA